MNILDILFPKRCLTCGKFGKYFCNHCVSTIRPIESRDTICPVCERPAIDGVTHSRCKTRYAPDGLTSFFRYDGVVRKAIKAIKYRLVTDLANEFVNLVPLSAFTHVTFTRYTHGVLVPIPLHSSRFRDRGFNQAEVLGRLVSRKLHVPTQTDILRRVKATTPQVEMKDRKKRLENMQDVFALRHDTCSLTHDTFVLFDDVFTTGATMRAAGEALKRVGAKFVWAVTMAR